MIALTVVSSTQSTVLGSNSALIEYRTKAFGPYRIRPNERCCPSHPVGGRQGPRSRAIPKRPQDPDVGDAATGRALATTERTVRLSRPPPRCGWRGACCPDVGAGVKTRPLGSGPAGFDIPVQVGITIRHSSVPRIGTSDGISAPTSNRTGREQPQRADRCFLIRIAGLQVWSICPPAVGLALRA